MTRLKLAVLLGIVVFFFTTGDSIAQPPLIFSSVRISSTFNPVGSGARAVGMGGAFIAVADDATAASWNPAGLIQLETPEVSLVYSWLHWREDYKSSAQPQTAGMNEKYADDINYFSAALPFQLFGQNFVASINYQRLFDMYKDLTSGFSLSGPFSSGDSYHVNLAQHFRQNGGIKAFSPAIAYQVTPRFSLGATFNIWTDKLFWDNEWSETTRSRGNTYFETASGTIPYAEHDTFIYEKFSDFEGFNMNLGFLWNITRVITIGGVFKTPFTADVKHTFYRTENSYFPLLNQSVTSEYAPPPDDQRIKMPASYGLGVAFRFSDAFTYSLDVFRAQWSEFFRAVPGIPGVVAGYPDEVSDIDNRLRYRSIVHDTTHIRTGMEYLFILEKTIIPLRLGLFYDPKASHKHPHTFWGFSVGSGGMIGNVVIDYAYQYRTGRDVDGGMPSISDAKADIDQHTFLLSIIYHFE